MHTTPAKWNKIGTKTITKTLSEKRDNSRNKKSTQYLGLYRGFLDHTGLLLPFHHQNWQVVSPSWCIGSHNATPVAIQIVVVNATPVAKQIVVRNATPVATKIVVKNATPVAKQIVVFNATPVAIQIVINATPIASKIVYIMLPQ